MITLFNSIIHFLKGTAPVSIIINIALGVVLLIVGIFLLKKQQPSPKQKVGAWISVIVSALAFVGAISNWLFSYIIF